MAIPCLRRGAIGDREKKPGNPLHSPLKSTNCRSFSREECGAGRTIPHMKLIPIVLLFASGTCFSLFVRPGVPAIPASSAQTFELAKSTKSKPTTKKPRKSRKKSAQEA
jgi:hypothetical protein